MEKQEIIKILSDLEESCPNDFQLGSLVRQFIIKNKFREEVETNKSDKILN